MSAEAFRLLGTPAAGGVLVVADHASNHVPADIELGICADLRSRHIAVDIGVMEVATHLARQSRFAAFLGGVSRLVCDFNRAADAPGIVPESSDGHAIAGNVLTPADREARIARFFRPYHAELAAILDRTPVSLILSLHSFTPRLASAPTEARPWQAGILYNDDDRAARIAMPLLAAEGLIVGDQQPYSGKVLNATMNRHAEAAGRPYLGIEIRQDEIADTAGQKLWADRLARVCRHVATAIARGQP